MKNRHKISKYSKKTLSLFMLFIHMRILGAASDIYNKDFVDDYHEIIKSFSKFLSDEGIEDVQNIYEYYNYAMWNGYFSMDHKLQYSLNRDIYINNAGMGIMSGGGVCLNYADMLALIYKEMGFNSNVVTCYANPSNVDIVTIKTDKNIKREIASNNSNYSNNFLLKILSKMLGNHAITYVESNGEIYFFDPTNLIYLNKTGNNDLNIINGEGKLNLRYYTSLVFNNINIFKIVTYQNENGYEKEVLEKQEIKINEEGLEKFYNKEKNNIENIAKNNEKNNIVILGLIYSILITSINHISRQMLKKMKISESEHLFPKLKKHFEENNIKTELEVLKNYELSEDEIRTEESMMKELLKKSIEFLIDNSDKTEMYVIILVSCLKYLGYESYVIDAFKYENKFIKKKISLIHYIDQDYNSYIYDYELGELICKNRDDVWCSLDGKYQYKIENDLICVKFENTNKENRVVNKEVAKVYRKIKY